MSLNKFYFLFFLGFAIVHGQEFPKSPIDSIPMGMLEEVVITATQTEKPRFSLPLPIQVVSKQEIQKINAIRLSDVLEEQTGLIMVPDFGGGEGVQIQGLDSEYTLILLDGMPLIGRSAGTLDLNRISIGNISKIEILKGASSSLYGSEALGGVINIITDEPTNGIGGNLYYKGATAALNAHDWQANLNYKKNKLGLTTSLNGYTNKGYDLTPSDKLYTVAPFYNYTFASNAYYRFNEKTSLNLSARYFGQKQDAQVNDTLVGAGTTTEWNSSLKLNHILNDQWRGYFEFYATQYLTHEYLQDPSHNIFSESNYNQLLLRPELRASYRLNPRHIFTGGMGLNYQTLDRTDFFETPSFKAPYIYAQYDAHFTKKLNTIVGLRFDHHSAYSSQWSPKIAFSYSINDQLVLKSSIGYGFKTPDLRQLYFDFTNSTVGYSVLGYNVVSTRIPEMEANGQISQLLADLRSFDSQLKPESSINYNLGASIRPLSNTSVEVNLFRNNLSNLIDTQAIARKTNGQNVFSYYNIGQVYTQGIECNVQWQWQNRLKLMGGYQWLLAKDKAAEEAFKEGNVYARNSSGNSFQLQPSDYFGLFNRSKHTANFKAFYTFTSWNSDLNLRVLYRSKYGLYDSNGNTYLDRYDDFVAGYALWNVAFNKRFYKNYQLSFGIDNLFNFIDAQNLSQIPGRIIYSKLNINL